MPCSVLPFRNKLWAFWSTMGIHPASFSFPFCVFSTSLLSIVHRLCRDSWVGQKCSCPAILECLGWFLESPSCERARLKHEVIVGLVRWSEDGFYFFLSFLSLAFILNLLNPIDSSLFMEEVVEHLVMATAPPSCINGVYWSHLVSSFKGFALFGFAQRSCIVSRNTFVGILIQRAKEEEKSTSTLFFHSS